MSSGAAMYQVNCPSCSFALKVPAAVLGKKGQCPKCKAVFLIPGVPASAPPAAAPAVQEPLTAPLVDPLDDPLGNSFGGASDPLFGGMPAQGSPFGNQAYGAPSYGAPGYAAPAANPWAIPPGGASPGGWQPPAAAPAPTASQSMANEYLARAAAEQAEAAQRAREQSNEGGGFFAAERRGIGAGVVGGIVMILIAVVWFVLGLMANRIFFYPPILFCIGIFAIVKGLLEGNYSGR